MNIPIPHFSEKSAGQSKKYMAAMRFNWTWAAIIVATLSSLGGAHVFEIKGLAAALGTVLLAEVVCLGFVQTLYLGGQAAVDTFVRMAVVIMTGKNGSVLAGEDAPTDPVPSTEPPAE